MCSFPTSLLNYVGTFTTNVVAAAPVLYCKKALEKSATVCYCKSISVGCRRFHSAGTLTLRQQFSPLRKNSNSIKEEKKRVNKTTES